MRNLLPIFIFALANSLSSTLFSAPTEIPKFRKYQDPPPVTQFSETCPSNRVDFGKLVQRLILKMPTPEYITQTTGWIKQCEMKLPDADRPSAARCSANITNFNEAFSRNVADPGLNIAPSGTRTVSRPIQLPFVLTDPRALDLLKFGPQDKVDAVMAALRKELPEKARIIQYQSGSSHARTFTIIVPQENEQIVYHYIGGQDDGYYMHGDVIRYPAKDGKPISNSPNLEYISLVYRQDEKNGPFSMHQETNNKWCQSCHRNGTRATVPLDGVFHSHTPNVSGQQIWNDFDSTRPIYENKLPGVNYDRLGPYFGGNQSNRTPEEKAKFMQTCVQDKNIADNPAQMKKIAEKMNCIGCHSDEQHQDLLRYPMDVREFSLSTLNTVILRGHMPQGASDFTTPERAALLSCLKQDYFGGFSDTYFSAGGQQPGTLMKYLGKECDQASIEAPISAPAAAPARAPGTAARKARK